MESASVKEEQPEFIVGNAADAPWEALDFHRLYKEELEAAGIKGASKKLDRVMGELSQKCPPIPPVNEVEKTTAVGAPKIVDDSCTNISEDAITAKFFDRATSVRKTLKKALNRDRKKREKNRKAFTNASKLPTSENPFECLRKEHEALLAKEKENAVALAKDEENVKDHKAKEKENGESCLENRKK
eukprot:g4479.t1